ncbi:hypothetical protein LB823_04920 [Tsukamurella sp. M9C]|uniref:hypothetical protein n=1 Tax=unclassified Tsukamurella TaxID=2633480 RepID=UPI001CCCFE4A|nr:hypothetical protein [Tsukamurella sp. M9C]MCA0155533.1 hypothetical protein [Tsukamurella sp. M9C]
MNAPLRMSVDPITTYRNLDGSVERWWSARTLTHRQVTIETTIKTLNNSAGEISAADVELLVTDQKSPRRIGIPVAVLDSVIAALTTARDDARTVIATDAGTE